MKTVYLIYTLKCSNLCLTIYICTIFCPMSDWQLLLLLFLQTRKKICNSQKNSGEVRIRSCPNFTPSYLFILKSFISHLLLRVCLQLNAIIFNFFFTERCIYTRALYYFMLNSYTRSKIWTYIAYAKSENCETLGKSQKPFSRIKVVQ